MTIAEKLAAKSISLGEFYDFTNSYAETAIWSSTDLDGNRLDEYTVDDFSMEAKSVIEQDCCKFLIENYELIKDDLDQAGTDFWLTRNEHGAGFWDGSWDDDVEDILTKQAESFDELYILPSVNKKFLTLS